MIAIISPAKSMDRPSTISDNLTYTQPHFKTEIKSLLTAIKKYKTKDLMELMDISEKLAQLNYERYKNFTLEFNIKTAAPAITSFTGDVYLGLDASSFTDSQLTTANEKIAILSGFYGLLKPLDLILPYRLEMGRSLAIGKSKNLYQFWGNKVAIALEDKMKLQKADYLINLASDEYFKVVKPYIDDKKIIHVNFMEEKNGKWTFISFNAKKARGLMANYIIKSKINSLKDLKNFNLEDYTYNASLSKDNELIFTRKFIPIAEKRNQK